MDDGVELGTRADDALVLHQRVDLAVAHARDALDLEFVEGLLDAWPLRVDDAPVDAGLEDWFRQLLEVVVGALWRDLRRRAFHRILPYEAVTVAPPVRRYVRGAVPNRRRNARLNAASDVNPAASATAATLPPPDRSRSAARAIRARATKRIGDFV